MIINGAPFGGRLTQGITMIKWKKKNGKIIETNAEEATIRAAVDLGWEQIKDKPKRKKK